MSRRRTIINLIFQILFIVMMVVSMFLEMINVEILCGVMYLAINTNTF